MNRFALPSFLQSRVLSTIFGVSESATNCAIHSRHYATFPGNKNMNCTVRGFLDIEEVHRGNPNSGTSFSTCFEQVFWSNQESALKITRFLLHRKLGAPCLPPTFHLCKKFMANISYFNTAGTLSRRRFGG
jgi:hypothetical protein